MKKFYLVLAILCALTHANEDSDKLFGDTKISLPCDLNTASCISNAGGESASFTIIPAPIVAMSESEVVVSGILRELKNPTLKIKGISMNMGNFESPLARFNDGSYHAKIMVAACHSPIMRYKLEIFENGESTGHFIYFDLRKMPKHK